MSGDLDRTLAAIAHPQRRRVVELLRAGPLSAGELSRAVGLPAPAMSRALRTLREADLVAESHPAHDARVRIYELRTCRMAELRDWLSEMDALWAEQLLAFKRHLERAP